MGKRLISQRKGSNKRYRSPSHRFETPLKHPKTKDVVKGVVEDIITDAGRTAPLVVVRTDKGMLHLIAPEGISTGQEVSINDDSSQINFGDVKRLGKIPEGQRIYNIEKHPGDGGKMCRASGMFGTVVAHEGGKTTIKLQTRKTIRLSSDCRASIGRVSGSGRVDKPFVKAGAKFYAMKKKNRLYPKVSASAMNAVDHPFGGSNFGKPKTISRNAPPGRKAGSISPKRTGKKK